MHSAGLVPFRRRPGHTEILIAHPGGPFWARRQEGAWSIVKGEVPAGEDPMDSARREFREETGWDPPDGPFVPLGEVVQRAGKRITAWAFEGDYDPTTLAGDTTTAVIRGREVRFPEIDEVRWCTEDESAVLLNPAQTVFHRRLREALDG